MGDVRDRSLVRVRKVAIAAAFLLTAVSLAVLGSSMILGDDEDSPSNSSEPEDRKQIIDPPRELTNFTLTNTAGESMQLSDLRGQPVLLFFGFTHCPDICPTTMAEFRAVKRQLGDQGNEVAFVFISVDGSRDTPEVVAEFIQRFDSEFIGLTGDEQKVRAIGEEYFLYFERVESEGTASAGGYAVDHTGYSYVIDEQGRLRIIYPFGTPPNVIAADLERTLE